ncbi:hypothetical protein D3C87_2136410 [compost metagenome]
MPDSGLDRGSGEKPCLAGIVLIIIERMGDGLRHDDRAREMHDRLDLVFREDLG